MDVRMPDGTLIRGVPDGTTKAELTAKYAAHIGSTAAPDNADTFDSGSMPQADTQKYLQSQYAQGHTDLGNALSAVPQAVGSMAINTLAPAGAGVESLFSGKPYADTIDKWKYNPANPDATALLQGVGSIPGLKQVGQTVGGAGQGLSNLTGGYISPSAGTDIVSTALAGIPFLAKGSMSNWAKTRLTNAVKNNPPEVNANVAAADRFLGPGNLTVPQSVDAGMAHSLGGQVAGTKAVRTANRQADLFANKLTNEARALAPIPLTQPGASANVVSNVTDALRARDTKLTQTAEGEYQAGKAHVSALSRVNPAPVEFPTLTAAANRILGENGDIWNTAPKELEGRVQTLLGYLLPPKPRVGPGQPVPPRGPITTTNAADALKLGKSLNQQFNAKERGALNQNMDEVFAELKSAYKTDLENAPSNPAIDKLREVNSNYVAGQQRIKTLQDSVPNEVLKSFGTTEPDKVIRRFSEMDPHVQRYTRDILLEHDPQTLRALQGHYIDLHLNDARTVGGGSMTAKYNPGALEPRQLAETGIFDSGTVQKLQDAQGAIEAIRTFFPQMVGNKNAPGILETSRVAAGTAGGNFSPVFAGGGAIRNLLGSKLQKLLLTTEGRNALLAGAKNQQSAATLIRNLALYNNAATTAQDVNAQ
jgi:hypothetical protein